MIKKFLILFLLISVNARAQYFEPLTERQIFTQVIFTIITCIDWNHTKNGIRNGNIEVNPALGERPSQQTIDILIGSAIISHALVTWLFPHKYRETWQMFWIGVESHTIFYNSNQPSIGISINFK